MDELTTMLIRLKDRENIVLPHRRHLYQLMANEMKIKQWKISIGYGLFQLLVGIAVIKLYLHGAIAILSALGIFFFIFTGVSVFTRRHVRRLCPRE